MAILTAWRNGDLVRLQNNDEIRLTSDGHYCSKLHTTVCNCNKHIIGYGKKIPYLTLIETSYLIETGSGIKNETY